eukprot:scaffold196_cov225-Chaetoceros_neogracile.AAC.1
MSTSNYTKLKKSVLQSLILVAAYGAVAGGESMKKGSKKNQRDDEVGSNLAELLFQSYHGSEYLGVVDKEGNDRMSHVAMFCDMTGPFEAMEGKNFVTVKTNQQVVADDGVKRTSETVTLSIDILLGMIGNWVITPDIKENLHLSALPNKRYADNADKVVSARTLLTKWESLVRDVKKIVAHECHFNGPDGQLPSGTKFEDFLQYVWEQEWKKLQYGKNGANKKKERSTALAAETDADMEDGIDGISVRDSDEFAKVPDNYVPPEIVKDGKWFPPGLCVYMAYVSPLTRFSDNYVQFFKGDAQSLDSSSAKTRSAERKEKMTKKHEQKTHKVKEEENNAGRSMSFVDPLQTANLLQRRSAEDFNRLTMICHTRQMLYESCVSEMEKCWDKCRILIEDMRDKTQKAECMEWSMYCSARDAVKQAKQDWTSAAKDQSSFSKVDEKGQMFNAMLTESAVLPAHGSSGSKRKAATMENQMKSPPAFNVSARRDSQTPMSNMTTDDIMGEGEGDDTSTIGNKNCASGHLCRCPDIPVTNHLCAICGIPVHIWCFGSNNEGGPCKCALCVNPQCICENAMNFGPPPPFVSN